MPNYNKVLKSMPHNAVGTKRIVSVASGSTISSVSYVPGSYHYVVAQSGGSNVTGSSQQLFGEQIILSGSSGGGLKLYEGTSNGAHSLIVKAPDTITTDKTLTLPDGPPTTSGYALVSTTAGVMSWAAFSGGNTYITGLAYAPSTQKLTATLSDSSTVLSNALTAFGNQIWLSGSNSGRVHFHEASANGNNYVQLKGPTDMGANNSYIISLPTGDGSNGQVMARSTGGQLVWADNTSSNYYVTGGTYDAGNDEIDFSGTAGFPAFSVDTSAFAKGSIAGTATYVPYFTASTALTGTNTFTWDNANGVLSLTNNIASSSPHTGHPKLSLININADGYPTMLEFYKNSASPASTDLIGYTRYAANNSAGTKTTFVEIATQSTNVTAGDEGAEYEIFTMKNGTKTKGFRTASGSVYLLNTEITGTLSTTGVATLGNNSITNTQTAGDNSTRIATTAFVTAAVAAAGGGDVSKVGTPVDNQLAVWTGANTIEGTTNLTYDGTDLDVDGTVNISKTTSEKNGFMFRGRSDTGFWEDNTDLFIGTPNSVYVMIDSNNNNTGEEFAIFTNNTTVGSATRLVTVEESGDVGIGTGSPSAKLDVNGDILARGGNSQVGGGYGFTLESNSNNQRYGLKYGSAGNIDDSDDLMLTNREVNGNLLFATADATGGAGGETTRMVIAHTTGRVGIGETNPTEKLHVYDSTSSNQLGIYGDSGDVTAINMYEGATKSAELLFEGSSNDLKLINRISGGDMIFRVENNTEAMRILNNGNVGIGTTSPSAKLHVQGTSKLNDWVYLSGSASQRIGGYDTQIWSIANGGTTPATVRHVFATSLSWDNNVELRYQIPSIVGDGSGVLKFGQIQKNNTNYSHGETQFFTSGAARLTINKQGRVGINTTSPSHGLTVFNTDFYLNSGDMHISQNKYFKNANDGGQSHGFPSSGKYVFNNVDVGIGTSAPEALLHVQGTSDLPIMVLSGSGDTSFHYKTTGSGDLSFQYHVQQGRSADVATINGNTGTEMTTMRTNVIDASNSYTLFRTRDAGSLVNTMILSGSKVGIGTTSPQRKLHVMTASAGSPGYGTYANMILESDDHSYFQFSSPSNKVQGINFGDGNDNAGAIYYDHASDYMRFFAGAAERVRIDSAGNVGIGTNAPDTKLHVYHTDTWVGHFERSNGTPHVKFSNDADGGDYGLFYADRDTFKIATRASAGTTYTDWISGIYDNVADTQSISIGNLDATAGAILYVSGTYAAPRVGIGTNSPSYPLHIYGAATQEVRIQATDSGAYSRLQFKSNDAGYGQLNFGDSAADTAGGLVYTHSTDTLNIRAANSNIANVTATGVGIGTTSPIQPLHVLTSANDKGILIDVSDNTHEGRLIFGDVASNGIGHIGYNHALDAMRFNVAGTEVMRATSNTLTVTGTISATAKSFNIPHPLYKDKRLVHGSLEGPEHGIYIRGTMETEEKGCLVELPEYWSAMCEDYTVQLTPHGPYTVYIKEKLKDKVMVECSQEDFKFDYYIVGARTDETLEVVQDG